MRGTGGKRELVRVGEKSGRESGNGRYREKKRESREKLVKDVT